MNEQEKLRAALVEQMGQMLLAIIEGQVERQALHERLAEAQKPPEQSPDE